MVKLKKLKQDDSCLYVEFGDTIMRSTVVTQGINYSGVIISSLRKTAIKSVNTLSIFTFKSALLF